MSKAIDLTGRKFGRLTVVSFDEGHEKRSWLCLCDCGTMKVVRGEDLCRGRTKSCGCLKLLSKVKDPNYYQIEDPWEAGRQSLDARYCPVI